MRYYTSTIYAHNSKAQGIYFLHCDTAYTNVEAEQLRAARDVNFTEVAEEVRDSWVFSRSKWILFKYHSSIR